MRNSKYITGAVMHSDARSAEAAGGRSEVRKSGTVCADGPDADGPDNEESSSLELLERCP